MPDTIVYRLLAQSCLIAAALAATPVAAQSIALDDAVVRALERDRSLARLEALADARAERAVADGALPDPELTLGYQNLPVRSFSTTDDMMTMAMVGVRQSFPPGRTRHLLRERGGAEADALRAEHDQRRLDIALAVRRTWLDWRYAHEALAVARDAAADFESLVELTVRRLAAGTARQQDVSQARVEHATLTERIIELEAMRDGAAAELARWLDAPVAEHTPGAAPGWPAPDPHSIRDALPAHAALRAPESAIEAGRLGVEIARQAYRPMWMAEVGYGFRNGTDRSDMVTAMVSVSVPLFSGNRQDRRLQGALREEDAARADRDDRLRQLSGRLEQQLALWLRYDALVELYAADLLPDATAGAAAARDAWGRDRATFDELIRARVAELDVALRALGTTRRRDDARIELMYLAGE